MRHQNDEKEDEGAHRIGETHRAEIAMSVVIVAKLPIGQHCNNQRENDAADQTVDETKHRQSNKEYACYGS